MRWGGGESRTLWNASVISGHLARNPSVAELPFRAHPCTVGKSDQNFRSHPGGAVVPK